MSSVTSIAEVQKDIKASLRGVKICEFIGDITILEYNFSSLGSSQLLKENVVENTKDR